MDYVQAHAISCSAEAHIKFNAKYCYYEYLNIARKHLTLPSESKA